MQNQQSTNFQLALTDTSLINNLELNYLEAMVAQYPWFSKAHQLLAKKYQLLQHENFDAQLQRAALHTFDRNELFTLIEKEIPAITQQKKPSAIFVEKIADEIIAEKTIIEENVLLNFQLTDNKNEPEKIIPNSTIREIKLEEKEIIKMPEMEQPKVIEKIIYVEKPATEQPVAKSTAAIISTENTFSGWLKKFSKGSTVEQLHQKPIAEKPKKTISPYEDEDTEVDDLRVDLNEMASFGLQQRDEFVTETMAKIFIQQEKYDKAISTYEQLMLLKPEKSALFAAQILDLKTKNQ